MEPDNTIIISIDNPSNTINAIGDISFDSINNTFNVYTDNHVWTTLDDNIDLNNITIVEPVEFEDCMPDVSKIEDMCRDYPALEKAYENFKTIYKMVHQDWQGKQDAENQLPF